MKMDMRELQFIEELGLIIERSGGSKTLGRTFGYLLLADKPKTLDEIAVDLLFSKATASLTIRQGLSARFFEKVGVPGERKTYYRANVQSWINTMAEQINVLTEWRNLVESGLGFVPADNHVAQENLKGLKDYLDFMRWYLTDIGEQYECWKKGEIDKNTVRRPPD
jgi:predicted transcriptional regulator